MARLNETFAGIPVILKNPLDAAAFGYSPVGYGNVAEMVIADPNEIWQLHMWQVGPWDPDAGVSGAVWVAARVPDDHVACFPNGFGIYEIDLSKPDYFMASANLFSLAEEMGRWDTKTQGTGPIMNVADVYAPALESWSTLCRKYRGYQLLDPNLKLPTPDEALNLKRPGGKPYRYPFSIKAPRKFSVADLNDYVRDTLEGTPYDVSRGPLAGPFGTWHRTQGSSFDVDGDKKNGPEVRNYNTIANDSSQFTEVCQMRGWLPNPIGGIIWWAPGQPFGALRVPFYAGVTRISEDYGHEVNQHFPKEVFQWGKGAGWAAVFTNTFADILYNYTRDDVKKFQSKVEGEARSLIPAIDKTALALYETDPAKAQEFLTQWCNQFAESATKQHWDFNSYLVWKYHNRAIWEPEQSMNPKMNDEAWWLEQAVEWQQEMEKRK
jgi:dipeptidase